jgi:superfamily II DNA or RNA helicase
VSQILHPGDVVRARRRTWRVVQIRPHDECRALSLTGIGPNAGHCELLTPFDVVDVVRAPSTASLQVGAAKWRRAARNLVARSGGHGLLRAAAAADIDILPHQLEPAVSVLRGDGCRVLLADDVGLGKTIQACLLIAELRARGLADRVIVLTPPGLRDQWRHELTNRFHVDTAIADFRGVRQCRATLPPDVNPWTTWPVAVASIDYVKRPEVLRAVLGAAWDVVIVDEAHHVANDGDRRRATAALASRAGYVVLVTATPHTGNSPAFLSLCNIGSHDDRLLVFRRTRQALASATRRRLHRLQIRCSTAERRMLARLKAFADAVQAEQGNVGREAWIALALLHKRAHSSAHALRISVMRRVERLAGVTSEAQLWLPLGDPGETSDDEAPDWHPALGLADSGLERRLLESIADSAALAELAESKIRVLKRLLRRVHEPVIVFTEYRDTLAWLSSQLQEPSLLLHGGLSRAERRAALDLFLAGTTRLLLATDAAAEGLNLHHACRTVVNLELPWNPMRLEQRIGRVDRIGQRRTVHAFHLVGVDTGEQQLLQDLRSRIAHAQAEIGAPDPLDGVFDDGPTEAIQSDAVDVASEVRRLALARALGTPQVDHARPLIRRARNRKTRARLAGRTLSLWEHVVQDGREQIVASLVVGALTRSDRVLLSRCKDVVAAVSADWEASAIATARAFADAGRRRATAIADNIAINRTSPHQPGLFDRRADFVHAALQAAHADAVAAQSERLNLLRLSADVVAGLPCLRLLLEP